jgi:hypothetical protein
MNCSIDQFIASVSVDIPGTSQRFWDYKMTDPGYTQPEDLLRAADIGARRLALCLCRKSPDMSEISKTRVLPLLHYADRTFRVPHPGVPHHQKEAPRGDTVLGRGLRSSAARLPAVLSPHRPSGLVTIASRR